MRSFQLTSVIVASMIIAFDNLFVKTEDGESIPVRDAWFAHNSPEVGDYITETGDYMSKADMAAYECMESPPEYTDSLGNPAPAVEDGDEEVDSTE